MITSSFRGHRPFRLFAWSFTALLFCAALCTPGVLRAQVYYGSVVGTVTDSSGAAVPGASVTVVNKGTGEKSSAKSSGQGSYSITQLPVGTYNVTVEAPNFKKFVAENVEVHTSTNTEINAVLPVGSSGETVTVEANQIQVQTTDASVGEVIDGTQVRELPLNGENFVGLTQLAPGVSAAASFDATGKGLQGGVNFSINGNPYTNNLFLVDGVNNNDQGSGRTILVYPATDTIAEFKILTNSYGAEYGQASGGIISITTLSGTNKIHGGFFYSGRNDALDTYDYFSKLNGTGKEKLRRSDYGYHISGPAIKDKLFLWFNQEWDKEKRGGSFATCVPTDAESAGDFTNAATKITGSPTTPTSAGNQVPVDQCGAQVGYFANQATTAVLGTQLSSIPTMFQNGSNPFKIASPDAAGLLIAQFYPSANVASDQRIVNSGGNNWAAAIPNTNNWSEWNVRGDYDVTKNNRATLRWTEDNWENPFPNNPGFDGLWGDSEYPTVGSNWSQPSKSVMAKLSTTVNSTMVNDVEFGYGHNAIITSLAGSRSSIVADLATAYPASFPSSLKTPGEFFGGWGGLNPYGSSQGEASIWNIAPYKNHEDIYTVQDNLSKVRGNHIYKVGFFYGNNAKVENSGNGADRPGLPTSVYCGAGSACAATTGLATGQGSANTGNALTNVLLPGTGAAPQEFSVSENSTDATAYVAWHDYEFYLQDSWKIRRNITLNYGFRWSFLREPYGSDNHWANWSLSHWSAAEATANPQDACNGTIIVPGTTPCQDAVKLLSGLGVNLPLSNGTPGPNSALVNQNNHNIAPRVGIAWDIFGNGTTALRAGAGQFYQRELVGIDEGMARTAPFVIGGSTNRALDTAAALTGITVSPNYGKDPRGVVPNSWQWNAAVEQQLAQNTTVSIGYVGNTGIHLTSMYDLNAIPKSNWVQSVFTNGNAVNALRPAFNFAQIGGFARGGHASYHSLQVLFRSQVKRSTFQAAYTWAHSIGNVEEDNSSGSFNQEAITDQTNPALDKGNTNINRPNIFVANEVVYLPKLDGYNQVLRQSIGGWELNGIFTAAHGSSLTIFSNATFNDANSQGSIISGLIGTGYNGNARPLTTDFSCNSGAKGNQILNVNAFSLVGYTLGTTPSNLERRGTCFGAPTTDLDSQLAKNWTVHERYQIKFAMDFFDILNHPNFNSGSLEAAGFTPSTISCGSTACSPTNRVITAESAVTGFGSVQALQPGKSNRELQYSLRFTF